MNIWSREIWQWVEQLPWWNYMFKKKVTTRCRQKAPGELGSQDSPQSQAKVSFVPLDYCVREQRSSLNTTCLYCKRVEPLPQVYFKNAPVATRNPSQAWRKFVNTVRKNGKWRLSGEGVCSFYRFWGEINYEHKCKVNGHGDWPWEFLQPFNEALSKSKELKCCQNQPLFVCIQPNCLCSSCIWVS